MPTSAIPAPVYTSVGHGDCLGTAVVVVAGMVVVVEDRAGAVVEVVVVAFTVVRPLMAEVPHPAAVMKTTETHMNLSVFMPASQAHYPKHFSGGVMTTTPPEATA